MHSAALRTLSPLIMPAAVLVAARLLLPYADAFPAAIRAWVPWGVLALGAVLAAAFSRGRVFFALCTLALAYLAARQWMTGGLASWPARTVYTAMCVFVPVNLALFAVFRERGIFNGHGGNKALLIIMQPQLDRGITGIFSQISGHVIIQKLYDADDLSTRPFF